MMMFGLILITLAVASAEVILDGACPNVQPVRNFDMNAYAGTWYQYKKLPLHNEVNGQCGTALYTLEGDSLRVKNSHVINGVEKYVVGVASKASDAGDSAKLILNTAVGRYSVVGPLWVLATDYSNYAISYSCKYNQKSNNHRLNVWVLSRSKTLEGDAKAAVDSYLSSTFGNVDPSQYVAIDQSEQACSTKSSLIYTALVGQ